MPATVVILGTLISSSCLKSVSTHREEASGVGVAILETVVVSGPSYLRHDFQASLSQKTKKDLPGLPMLKIQERSQVHRPPLSCEVRKDISSPGLFHPENSGKISDFQAS